VAGYSPNRMKGSLWPMNAQQAPAPRARQSMAVPRHRASISAHRTNGTIATAATIAAVSADQWFDIAASAVVGGAVSTVLFATVLRYDLRVVPPLVAVYVSAALVAEALQKGTTQAALLGAIGVAATLAVAWAATLYILARGEIPRAATQPAAIPGSE